MVRCLLVDDESPAIELLKNHITMLSDLEVVSSCYSAVEAFEILKKEKIDLLFLDIEMPVLKGLDFLKAMKHSPKVIITTAYREYALQGYDLDIVDYLLKPISFERFVKSVDRYYDRTKSPLIAAVEKEQINSFFYVNVNKKHHKIVFDDVLYIESMKDYVRIHTVHKKLVIKSNIGKIEAELPSNLFLRIHRSYIVSISKITAYNQKDIEIEEIEIPIGSSYSKKVIGLLST